MQFMLKLQILMVKFSFLCNISFSCWLLGDFVFQTPTGALPLDPTGGFRPPDPIAWPVF